MNFDELSEREQIILTEYINLMKEIGYYHMFSFLKKEGQHDVSWCIYKENDIWISCVYERGITFGFRKYYDLYNLLLDTFEGFEKKMEDYCKEVFPERVQLHFNNHKTK